MAQEFQTAFVSYGRTDSKAFAIQLHQRLTDQGFKIWFDQNDIPLAVDFQDQIDDGIDRANNFLFIISPHSVNSLYCRKEIEQAIRRNKRIIPLMHVEQISLETWQQRNPNASTNWETYQAQGLHSSYPNMHPAIAKINWINFREGIDDFDQALASLIEIFERHRAYVRQHTFFLTKALEWEQHQKQSRYLLIGEDYQQAKAWLEIRFKTEQPPCIPTDLHCEFICESIKNTNNLMTQVFLAHAEADDSIAQQVLKTLMREGFTVWTNKTDIQTGATFQEAINRGIEEADNVVYLLSPASLQSDYCQQELTYALSLNKRIIPLLIRETDLNQAPPVLRGLQHIDLTDNLVQADYQQDESQLIRILRQDGLYYTIHKFLLAKALKWERQRQNPSLLVRGHTLRYAEAWLKSAKLRSQHLPTPLQEEFVAASLRQPPEQFLDVFISYSRIDSDFARNLNDSLQTQGKTTWFDQQTIASGSNFQQEIYRGIETSHHFLFILSPSSVKSPYCAGEVEYAQKLNKRIVTVLHQPVSTADLHPGLAAIQWIDFNKNDRDFFANFGELIRTLDTDLEYLRSHTRLLGRALEWEQADDPSFLLRGTDLVAAEQWLKQTVGKEPAPTDLQIRYIKTSRKAPYRQAKPHTVVLTSLMVTLLVVGVRSLGFLQPVELKLFDQLLRLRPSAPPDLRLLVVRITENDLQQTRQDPPSDQTIAQLLNKLEQYQPQAIGLDLYRDIPVGTGRAELLKVLKQDNLMVACRTPSDTNPQDTGNRPPDVVPDERLGLSDVIAEDDRVIRRHLLSLEPPEASPCQTPFTLSLQLAFQYLDAQKIEVKETQAGYLQIRQTVFTPLQEPTGGYQRFDHGGHQVLLNYRFPVVATMPNVTLTQVLRGEVQPDQVKGKIVLVGMDKAGRDRHFTPESESQDVAGVFIQAQMVSQILSAAFNQRPLISAWSRWGDALWIGGWALVGGVLVWRWRRFLLPGILSSLVILGGTCYILLIQGIWVPLLPAALALVLSSGGVVIFTSLNELRLADGRKIHQFLGKSLKKS